MSAARVRLAWPCCVGRTPLRPVLHGEPHPGRLPGHSERRSDAGPADTRSRRVSTRSCMSASIWSAAACCRGRLASSSLAGCSCHRAISGAAFSASAWVDWPMQSLHMQTPGPATSLAPDPLSLLQNEQHSGVLRAGGLCSRASRRDSAGIRILDGFCWRSPGRRPLAGAPPGGCWSARACCRGVTGRPARVASQLSLRLGKDA
jgi:hypothetical protein